MKFDPHPLRDAEITPGPEPYPLDRYAEAFATRGGTRVPPSVRALPTMRTTRGDTRWTWGRRVDRPTSTNAPQIFAPSDLERKPVEQPSKYGTLDELLRRLSKR
jgi:hypothetical protein